MLYLIDGYNLLHAMGLLSGRSGPGGLERARRGLTALLAAAFGAQASEIVVVFDAPGHASRRESPQDPTGIDVRFAHGEEADDLIEKLIRDAPLPRRLAVVSNDRRIHEAARRRRCRMLSCGEFLDELDRLRGPSPTRTQPAPESKPVVSEAEHWLREFADLEKDPIMKSLFDPAEFYDPPKE
jgi:hypothetical protein